MTTKFPGQDFQGVSINPTYQPIPKDQYQWRYDNKKWVKIPGSPPGTYDGKCGLYYLYKIPLVVICDYYLNFRKDEKKKHSTIQMVTLKELLICRRRLNPIKEN